MRLIHDKHEKAQKGQFVCTHRTHAFVNGHFCHLCHTCKYVTLHEIQTKIVAYVDNYSIDFHCLVWIERGIIPLHKNMLHSF